MGHSRASRERERDLRGSSNASRAEETAREELDQEEDEEREYERGDGDDRQLQSPALLECCLHRDRSLAQGAAISPPLRKGASEPRTLKQRMKELGGKPRDFLKRKAKGQGPESAVPLTGTWRPKFGTR